MSQNLKGVDYSSECYTIVFLTVSSHNGQMFSFVNQLNNRFEFFWDRWGKWKDILTPYSSHAFLVKSYNTSSDSGMGFSPDTHLCEFINLHEARVFNSAYLTKYNKLAGSNKIDDVNALAGEFGTALLDMVELRSEWMDVCEKVANSIFNREVFSTFFGDNPTPGEPVVPWDRDLFKTEHIQGFADAFVYDSEQPLIMKYVTQDEE